jgi:hypothetical protein
MKNYKDYIGKTFKGFKFEDKKYSGLNYNPEMDKFIGEDLKIEYYDDGEYNSFFTDSGYHYPAELVIAQLEKQETENETFKPKRGDRVLVWDNDEEYAKERIFLCEINGAKRPYVCVEKRDEQLFEEGKPFSAFEWENMKPLPKKVIEKDTLVWCKNYENNLWSQRFYSHFSEGVHYCFLGQKKSNERTETTSWNIVTTENPFE